MTAKIGIKYIKEINMKTLQKKHPMFYIECLLLYDVTLIVIVLSYFYHILFLLYEQISCIPHMPSKIL